MAKTDANTAVFMDSANDGDEDILMKIYEDGKEEERKSFLTYKN